MCGVRWLPSPSSVPCSLTGTVVVAVAGYGHPQGLVTADTDVSFSVWARLETPQVSVQRLA